MKLVRENINEKFAEQSDPIKDMGIGPFPRDFIPRYVLIKLFPGMTYPLGSIFGNARGWDTLGLFYDTKTYYSSAWDEDYFKPWIGEFFEKYEE